MKTTNNTAADTVIAIAASYKEETILYGSFWLSDEDFSLVGERGPAPDWVEVKYDPSVTEGGVEVTFRLPMEDEDVTPQELEKLFGMFLGTEFRSWDVLGKGCIWLHDVSHPYRLSEGELLWLTPDKNGDWEVCSWDD